MTAPVFTDGDPGPEIRRKLNEMGVLFQEAIDGLFGPQGWSPVLAIVADGERRVFEVVDWVGGQDTKPTELGYVGAAGIVPDIADAVDIRGPVGGDGAPGPANSLAIGTVTEGVTADAEITGTAPSQLLNLVLPKATDGLDGLNGWTPVFALVADGARVVMQVVDWTGGTGTKPATGKYVGPTGLATLIADGVDVRGPAGAGGGGSGDVVGPASSVNNGVALFDGTTGKLIKDGGVLGTAAFSATSAFATTAQGAKADTAVQPGSLATVATSGAYADLSGKPTLGTASALDVPATGNAATGEVVKGNDTRLSDSRTPTGTAGGVLSGSYPNPSFAVDMATQAELDAVSSVANAKLGDAPSDGKTYGRKDGAWSEVASGGATYRIGDVQIAPTAPATGTWLLCDGSVYLQSSYTALYSELGIIANKPGESAPYVATSFTSGAWVNIAYGDGVFVATRAIASVNSIRTSTDGGVTWTDCTTPTSQAWGSIAYGNGVFIVLPTDSTSSNVCAVSADGGATWVNKTLPLTTQWHKISFVNGRFIATQLGSSATIYQSTNGDSWSSITLPTNARWRDVAYGNGLLVIVAWQNSSNAATNAAVVSSDDGLSWVARTLPASGTWLALAFGNGNFVALNASTAQAATSPDGITWTARTLPASSNWNRIAFGNGTFVALTSTSGTLSAISADGIGWAQKTLPSASSWQGIAFGANRVLVHGNSTAGAYAYLGINYDPSTQFAVPKPISQDINSWVRAV